MQGRVTKFRIVNIHYAKNTIMHKDTKFDFCIENPSTNERTEASNALMSLENGDGKGVLLQLFTNIFDPMADWKGGKNKIEHLFFNAKKKPINYTGYILLELDVDGYRRLMLGLGITPRLLNREQQREERTDLTVDYIQFVREYSLDDEFDIHSLPLYDEENGEAISLKDFKNLVDKEYKDEIEIITVNNRRAYSQLLHSYGYTASAIANMKQINQREGSVEAFFEGAFSNEGLFYHRIIPAINDDLQNTDRSKETSDLVLAFLDTVKIAKDFPELMRISNSADTVKELLEPIKEGLLQGVDLEEQAELLKKKGYAIKEKLEDAQRINKREIEIVEKEKFNQHQLLEDIQYNFDNMEYSKHKSEKLANERQNNELKKEIDKLVSDEKSLVDELRSEDERLRLKFYSNLQTEIEAKINLRNELEGSLEYKDTAFKIDNSRKEIQQRWEKYIYPSWKSLLRDSELYCLSLKKELKEIRTLEDELVEQKAEMKSNRKQLKTAIDGHKIKLDTVISKRHGEKVRFDLAGVITQKMQLIDDSMERKNHLQLELQNTREDYAEALGNNKFLKNSHTEQETRLQGLVSELANAIELEVIFEDQINNYLKCDSKPSENKRVWFQNKLTEVGNKVQTYRNISSESKKALWEMEDDIELISESKDFDLWIPNKEILSFKRKLTEQGIHSMLGSELLSQLTPNQRYEEFLKNPLTPYSVVVLQSDFMRIDFSLLKEDLNRAVVPLLIREEMTNEKENESFSEELFKLNTSGYIVGGKGFQLITNEESWENWKQEFETNTDRINNKIKEIEALEIDGDWLISHLNLQLNKKTSDEILEDKENAQKTLSQLLGEIEQNEKDLKTFQSTIENLELSINDITALINKETDNHRDLMNWKDDCLVNEKNESDSKELENQINLITERISTVRSEADDKDSHIRTVRNELDKWTLNARDYLKQIQSPVVNATFPPSPIVSEAAIEHNVERTKPSFNEVLDQQSLLLLGTYQELANNAGTISHRIDLQNHSIKNLTSNREPHLNWLNQNVSGWELLPIPEETVAEIQDKIKLLDSKKANLNSKIIEMRIKSEGMELQLKRDNETLKMQERVFRTKHDKHAVYLSGLDYEHEKAKLEEQKSEANVFLLDLDNKLNAITKLQRDVDLLLNTVLANKYLIASSFVLTEEENELAETTPNLLVNEWLSRNNNIEEELGKFKRILEKSYNQLSFEIDKDKTLAVHIKEPFKGVIIQIQNSHFKRAIEQVDSIIFWAQKEVEKRAESKKQCDEAIRFYTERCTKRVQDVITSLKVFINKMRVKNIDGDYVELVRYDRNYKFPDNKADIQTRIKEYCENAIAAVIKKNPNTENIKTKDVEHLVNISQLMKIVLGKFPKLYIYIPDGTGSLLTDKPKEHLYKEWEVINLGDNQTSSNSGGQTIMAQIILISMLQKKANDDNWTMIITDNLFGAMSAKKLIQPLFVALEMLKIQWITVVSEAPVQVTSNFDAVYLLEVDYQQGQGIITYDVEYRERRYLERFQAIERAKNQAGDKEKSV